MSSQSDIEYVGASRGCIPPYPCGRGAGAHGCDLPCECEAIANGRYERAGGYRMDIADISRLGAPSPAYAKVPEDSKQYELGARWYLLYGSLGRLNEGVHTVHEHEDGTITVNPSIVMPTMRDGRRWHGWLRAGVFCDGQWETA